MEQQSHLLDRGDARQAACAKAQRVVACSIKTTQEYKSSLISHASPRPNKRALLRLMSFSLSVMCFAARTISSYTLVYNSQS